MNEHWQAIERTVYLLERVISPDARIRQNVHLPELGTGTLRQCDVVIITGTRPRETTTIVEVSARRRPVNVQTFEAWCAKRAKLGVQHLICVSTRGFTKAVVQDAATLGSTVRLITLSGSTTPPFGIAGTEMLPWQSTTINRREVEIRANGAFDPGTKVPTVSTAVLSFPDCERRIEEICDGVWKGTVEARNVATDYHGSSFKRTYEIDLSQFQGPAHLKGAEPRLPIVSLQIAEQCEHRSIPMTRSILAYEQRGQLGPLAWVLFAEGTYGGHSIFCTVIVDEGEAGKVNVRSVHLSTPPGLTTLTSGVEYVITRQGSTAS